MCLNPKLINREGKRKETNYNGQKGEYYNIITYSKCGYCEQCVNEKANNWVIRNHYEKQNHKDICFITLTYAENPIFLIKKHLQDFKKRLRRYLEYHYKIKIRTFDCGEYGSEEYTHRPHFHIICYGWKEENKNLKFWEINKKGNITYLSKTINKLWKYGIATYQNFNEYEIPYISLYTTAKENFANAYTSSIDKAKKFIKHLKDNKKSFKTHRLLMIKELYKEIKIAEKEKQNYIIIKEFNSWSKGLGYEVFEKEYKKMKEYDFKEYIEDKTFVTPTAWIKKLANNDDKCAIAHMLALQSELASKSKSEKELREENRLSVAYEHKKNVEKLKNTTTIL